MGGGISMDEEAHKGPFCGIPFTWRMEADTCNGSPCGASPASEGRVRGGGEGGVTVGRRGVSSSFGWPIVPCPPPSTPTATLVMLSEAVQKDEAEMETGESKEEGKGPHDEGGGEEARKGGGGGPVFCHGGNGQCFFHHV